ncbi:MAG: sigma 54-interacting transcriptional regulator [Desulfopila sp.]
MTTPALQPAVDGSYDERLRFETMLSNISTRFVNLPVKRIDQEIEACLELIVTTLDIDRCSVVQFTPDKSELVVSHAYVKPGLRAMPNLVLNRDQPYYTKRMLGGEAIVMESVSELPKEAEAERRHCLKEGIRSSALIPLAVSGRLLGVVGFAALTKERKWPRILVQRMKMIGVVFANALLREESEQELQRAFTEIQELKERLEAENTFLKEEMCQQPRNKNFIGASEAMRNVLKRVDQVAKTDTTVLILGETGTGKELLAQAIHNQSLRRERPMITVNCAALPVNLVESELFGHEKGAFTGAHSRRIGRFELADTSTIFLDEIGELTAELQVKLLRVLQLKTFERLGGHGVIETDVRVIAATNRDLYQEVQTGDFRMDLYYRLNVFPIIVPPLSSRREDIPDLVWFFIHEFKEKMGKRIDTVKKSTMQRLRNYQWPGNIRELRNIIERAMIISNGNVLELELPEHGNGGGKIKNFHDLQRDHIQQVMEYTEWRVRGAGGAAEILELKPTTLEAKMSKLGITRPPAKR